MDVPKLEVDQSCSCQPTPQQCWIWATSETYTTAFGNARSLTHWVRPGIELTSSLILVGFLTHWTTMGTPSFILFFGHTHSILKFPDQGSNPHQSSGNAGYLTCWTTKELLFHYLFFSFLGPHPKHMEVPRLGVQLEELQLTVYTTATQHPSCICDLHYSSQQCWILNTLSKARDRTYNLMVPSRIHFRYGTTVILICFGSMISYSV